MYFLRAILISALVLATSLSGATAESVEQALEHTQFAADSGHSEKDLCCKANAKTAEVCHHAPALVPDQRRASILHATDSTWFVQLVLVLTGIETSGPLDPPRPA